MTRRAYSWLLNAALIVAALNSSLYAEIKAERQVEEYYSHASKYAGQKDWHRAIEYLLRANELLPEEKSIIKQLAVFYNNWAMELFGEGELGAAQERLEKAVSYDPENKSIKTNLSRLLLEKARGEYEKGYVETAINIIESAIKADSGNIDAYIFLGDIYYGQDNFEAAGRNWKKAHGLEPSRGDLAEREKRLQKEEAVEGGFKEKWNLYFKIKFEGSRQDDVIYKISDKLMQAYRDVGWAFEYYPRLPTTVIIYTSDQFRSITGKSDITIGVYDGKMRLRLTDITKNEAVLKKLIYHEYGHAVIHQLFLKNIPVWLHEGIAGWLEDPQYKLAGADRDFLRRIVATKGLNGFSGMNKCFSDGASGEETRLGYLESKLFIQYFMQRYNRHYLKEILSALNEGGSFEEATDKIFRLTPQQLYSNFIEYLKGVI